MQAKMPCRNAPETLGWIALLLIPALTVQSMAEGFKNPPEGAAALGRAGGRIAIADDAAAVSHNPANLVDLEGTEDQVLLQAPGIEPDLAEIAGVVGWSAAVVDAQRRAGDRSATPGVWGAAAYQFGGSGE